MKRAILGLSLLATACAQAPGARPAAPSAAPVTPPAPPAGMQYLYGSAEAAALSRQAYNALVDAVRARLAARDGQSVVLAPGATPADPRFVDCAGRPPAVVLDADETSILNLGYEANDARLGLSYDDARWQRWEETGAGAVMAVPGAVEAFAALRAMGVTPVINSNRLARFAGQTVDALSRAGLGTFRHGDTLWLKGDAGTGSAKDARRSAIAGRYCVLAMAGDQLGDFSDAFAGAPGARRAAAQAPATAALWGRGWFVLPNPVYGSGLGAGWDETFPRDKSWTDPAGEKR